MVSGGRGWCRQVGPARQCLEERAVAGLLGLLPFGPRDEEGRGPAGPACWPSGPCGEEGGRSGWACWLAF